MSTARFDEANPLDLAMALLGAFGVWLIRRTWIKSVSDAQADLGTVD